jgi:hypothetical protein
MKPQLIKKLTLHKETLRTLTDTELHNVVGGDSGGASAGQSCECTLRCSLVCPPPPQSANSCPCNESGSPRCILIG